MKILIISPHRDDAAFSLTLTIHALLRADHSVTVMNCFTRSDYAPFADISFVHLNDVRTFVSAVRSREDESWRRLQKSNSLKFDDLNLRDAPLRLRIPLDELCTREIPAEDKAMLAIQKAVQKSGAEVLLLPLALGGHIDHRTARDAAFQSTSSPAIAFYEDLPYAAWAEVTPTIEDFASDLGQRLRVNLQPVITPLAIESAVDTKLRSALCYDSQIDTETAHRIAAFCERYQGSERLWGNAAWAQQTSILLQN